ncbi:MAG TPA: outer membrane protein assembly factor BamD [Ghiorsea sp.]|nr:outer membrane protein assembly factor BamD [Ghiorsea sp.]
MMSAKLSLIVLSMFFYAINAFAVSNADAIQAYLQQGKPEQAISTAYLLLNEGKVDDVERKALLELIIKAQLIIVKAKHYEDVKPAIRAIQSLIQEFPEQINEPQLIENMITLYWHQNSLEEAQAEILDLQNRYPQSTQAQRSWLTLGKIYFIHKNYADARSSLLRFSAAYAEHSAEGLDVRIWTALVDYAEGRFSIAYQALQKAFDKKPLRITSQDNIYARFIQLLRIQKQHTQALKQANHFLSLYKTSSHTPEIRLLQADMQQLQANPNESDIIKTYTILAETYADTIIGKQAFMRRMMLQMKEQKTYAAIKPAIIALKRIANGNQMSEVEDEAFFHEALLWHQALLYDEENTPQQATYASLKQFSLAQKSTHADIAAQATEQGKQSFSTYNKRLLQREHWATAIKLWQSFPHFQPKMQDAAQLYFDIAHAYRVSMWFQQAEYIFSQLQRLAKASVWAEKVALEQAKIWADRQDKQAITKIMQWLDTHEYTMYRPEMLLIVAQIQLHEKNASLASHTLNMIQPSDLTPASKAMFWQTLAQTNQALSRWHMAALAWKTYATLDVQNPQQAMLKEAHTRFKANEFAKAETLYNNTPEDLHTPVWAYRFSVSQLKNGKIKQATIRLTQLKNNPNAGVYTSLAALTLAERNADQLLETNL